MRNFIAIALGLMLLISAAAAQGNENTATVTVNEATTGLLVTGANVIQTSDLEANLLGNGILADQTAFLLIEDSDLTGLGDGKTNAIQVADMIINDTGNANVDSQLLGLFQIENDVAIGNITQIGVQEIDSIGNENIVDQTTQATAGISDAGSVFNLLTNSDLWQVSCLDAHVKGNGNMATQDVDQFAVGNDLVNSLLYEQIVVDAKIIGNENNLGIDSIQLATQTASDNLLTGSRADQLIYMDEQIVGNLDDVIQSADESFLDNLLTTSIACQTINETAKSLGNSNTINQLPALTNTGNLATGGRLQQTANIETNA